MRLSNKYGGLQFFAPSKPAACIMNFDSHISKVHSPAGTVSSGSWSWSEVEWTQSGQSVNSNYDCPRTYIVTLDSGYIIDTVTIGGYSTTETPVIADDGLSFSGEFSYGSPITITITSKQGGGGRVQ